jgi:hypothetical protein
MKKLPETGKIVDRQDAKAQRSEPDWRSNLKAKR